MTWYDCRKKFVVLIIWKRELLETITIIICNKIYVNSHFTFFNSFHV